MISSKEPPRSRNRPSLYRGLLIYYGLLQTLHLVGLAIEMLSWRGGSTDFLLLAPAPAGGWTAQAIDFLLGLGAADFMLIMLSYVFLAGVWRAARWADALGLTCLVAFTLTAFVFAAGTVASGGWSEHLNYWIESALFAPVLLLLGGHARKLWRAGSGHRES